MPAPPIFGVEGRRAATYLIDYEIGPGRAVIVDRERFDQNRMPGPRYMGAWQVDGAEGSRVTLCRTSGDSEAEIAKALELWLRLWLTSLGEALGLELRERKP